MSYTKNLYTNSAKPANFHLVGTVPEKLAQIVWGPGTKAALLEFPDGPRSTLGYYLYLVQKGETPPGSSTVPGFPGLFELRDDDESAWYRIIHLKKVDDKIHVLHCFAKQSNQIEKRDIRTIEQRLARLNEWLVEGAKHAKWDKQSRSDNGKRFR